jgi:hypothetical protein
VIDAGKSEDGSRLHDCTRYSVRKKRRSKPKYKENTEASKKTYSEKKETPKMEAKYHSPAFLKKAEKLAEKKKPSKKK